MRLRHFLLVMAGSLGLLLGLLAAVSAGSQEEQAQLRASANGAVPNVEFTKGVNPDRASAGDVLTYALTLANTGVEPVAGLSVVDAIPISTTFGGFLPGKEAVYDDAQKAVSWSGELDPSQKHDIAFTVTIASQVKNLPSSIVNLARLEDDSGHVSEATITTFVTKTVMLPLIAKPFSAPELTPIAAPGASRFYWVNWSEVDRADAYVLQEATVADFSSDVSSTVTSGVSRRVDSRDIREYFYRAKARSTAFGDGNWSTVQSVKVYWEKEPNQPYTTATGPMVSGTVHYGFPNDQKDFFWFDAGPSGKITLDLNGHNGTGVQLQLFYYTGSGLERVAYKGLPPYSIDYTYSGQAGRYYVYVYATGNYNPDAPYTLYAQFPQP